MNRRHFISAALAAIPAIGFASVITKAPDVIHSGFNVTMLKDMLTTLGITVDPDMRGPVTVLSHGWAAEAGLYKFTPELKRSIRQQGYSLEEYLAMQLKMRKVHIFSYFHTIELPIIRLEDAAIATATCVRFATCSEQDMDRPRNPTAAQDYQTMTGRKLPV